MKCRVCGNPANISLRAYNTALCESDFRSFLEKRVHTTITKYRLINPGEKPIIAVSGGKDSLALWSMLNKLGFEADGMYVNLAIGDYSETSLKKIKQMVDIIGRKVYIFSLGNTFNKGIEELSKIIRRTPCSACGMIKRYVMNKVCMDKGYTVLVTGHNLDDEAAALMGNFLYWKEDYLWKKNISLDPTEGHLSKKVKPLFLCSEREVAAYAIMSGIDYIYDECPYSRNASSILYKQTLNRIEERSPGTKLMFVKGYLKRARDVKVQNDQAGFCSICGYPSFSETCNFCKTFERFGIATDIRFDEYGPADS